MKPDKELLRRYNVPVPRYTSYPPANHFKDNFTENEYLQMVKQSNQQGSTNIALYIHIPFCKKICFYCGCNACAIKKDNEIKDYINAIKTEVNMIAGYIDKSRKVSQIHYGGGTPNSINIEYLEELNHLIFEEFAFIENPEIAIECNPAYLDYKYMERLLKAGFNRISLGIQDFNHDVLKTVNREASGIPVKQMVDFLKGSNSAVSVNLDFIYGLPLQTVESFENTIQQALTIRPNRLVTFSYAHVPWVKEHQKILEKKGLPDMDEKTSMFLQSKALLLEAGYKPIGLDHYVLPDDELALAFNNHQLHRNFQGYCTKRTTGQVYAFGVSAISQLDMGYAQNLKDTGNYIQSLKMGLLPIEKGHIITPEQSIIKNAITELMCNLRLDINEFCAQHSVSLNEFMDITGFATDKMDGFIKDKLLLLSDNTITVTETGSMFIRNIAASFDPAYQPESNKYSQSV